MGSEYKKIKKEEQGISLLYVSYVLFFLVFFWSFFFYWRLDCCC